MNKTIKLEEAIYLTAVFKIFENRKIFQMYLNRTRIHEDGIEKIQELEFFFNTLSKSISI